MAEQQPPTDPPSRPTGAGAPRRSATIPPLGAEPPPHPSGPASGPSPVKNSGPNLAPVDAPPPKSFNLPAEIREGDETVTLTIDGEAVTVRKGTNVLEAAKLVGKDICHFCYHPGLPIA